MQWNLVLAKTVLFVSLTKFAQIMMLKWTNGEAYMPGRDGRNA